MLGGFYFPGATSNNELNGTKAPSVSFLCVEKLTHNFNKYSENRKISSHF